MILLVFEGQVEEPRVMSTIRTLFFNRGKDQIICSYGADTYTLWKDIQRHLQDGYEADVFEIIKERLHTRNDHSLDKYKSYEIDSVYLFFDLDPHNSTIPLNNLMSAILGMTEFFNDAMENGQIYIAYPMAEALYCEDSCNDSNYRDAQVMLEDCKRFKEWCRRYNLAVRPNGILLKTAKDGTVSEELTEGRLLSLKRSWQSVISMNVSKANLLCVGEYSLPRNIDDVRQINILKKEYNDYITSRSSVSILSHYALFLYEYFSGSPRL